MNSCKIYKSDKFYKILTESLNTLGMGISTFPVHILPIATNFEELNNSILDCINSSKEELEMSPDSHEFAIHSQNVLNALREKSYTNLYKFSKGCSIEKENNTFKLILYKLYDQAKPRYGFVGDKSISFKNIDELVEFIMNW